MTNRLAYGDGVASLEAAALAVGRLDAALLVIRRYRPGRSGASSTRRVVMPRWMAAGSISIGSPRSCTACRSGSAPPCPWPSREARSPPSPTRSSCAPGRSSPIPDSRICSTVVWPTFGRPGRAAGADRRRPGAASLDHPGRQPDRDPRRPALLPQGARHQPPAAGAADRQRRAEARRV